jgi:menaquinone-dependent protoporphyrinogen oxidase
MILVAYASRYGSTREVAETIAKVVGGEARLAADVDDLARYDAVVLGGGIYMGRWHKDARGFVRRFRQELLEVPVALFALGPLDEEAAHWVTAKRQFDAAIQKLPVEPVDTRLFGGAVDPTNLHFPFNHMPAADVRDWDAVREWAEELAERFEPATTLVGAGPRTGR